MAKTDTTILVVEDDSKIRSLLQQILEREGYQVLYASNLKLAMQQLELAYVHLVLLDWMLGKDDGMDVFRAARANNNLRDIPFILLTARGSMDDQVYGLDQGVSDYITKPFARAMLLARVRSCLRHHTRTHHQAIRANGYELSFTNNTFTTDNGGVRLDPSDCRLLAMLIQHENTPVPRSRLLTAITISNQRVELRTVDVHVSRMRKRLKKIGAEWHIQTQHSLGYMFTTTRKNRRQKSDSKKQKMLKVSNSL